MQASFEKIVNTKRKRGFDGDKESDKKLTQQRRKARKQKRELPEGD